MNSNIGWFQPEQQGPAMQLWHSIWKRAKMDVNDSQPDYIQLSGVGGGDNNAGGPEGKGGVPEAGDNEKSSGNNSGHASNGQYNPYNPYNNNPAKRVVTDNPASTFRYNDKPSICAKYDGTPWRVRERYNTGIIGLHEVSTIINFWRHF